MWQRQWRSAEPRPARTHPTPPTRKGQGAQHTEHGLVHRGAEEEKLAELVEVGGVNGVLRGNMGVRGGHRSSLRDPAPTRHSATAPPAPSPLLPTTSPSRPFSPLRLVTLNTMAAYATSAGMVATALIMPNTSARDRSVPRSWPNTSRATATSSPPGAKLPPLAATAAAAAEALLEAGVPAP